MDDAAKAIVTPYGQQLWVQSGVEIRKPSLKHLLMKQADMSQYELNPEACSTLKKRMMHD